MRAFLRSAVLGSGLTLAALVFGGSLGSAQDSNTTAPSASVPSAPVQSAPAPSASGATSGPASAPAAPRASDLSEAPPDEAAPTAPALPAPSADDARDADTPAANATANAESAPPPPAPKRPRYASVVLQALDKVTAETLRFEAKVNEPVRYKDLVITVHACETTATDEDFSEAAAHLEVQYQPDVLPGRAPQVARQVFRGWMFANSPGLNPFQHPIYDVWVIACKTPAPAPAPPPASAAGPVTGASL